MTPTSAHDAAGNRTRLADVLSGSGWDGAGVTTYAYDALDRVTALTHQVGGLRPPRLMVPGQGDVPSRARDRAFAGNDPGA